MGRFEFTITVLAASVLGLSGVANASVAAATVTAKAAAPVITAQTAQFSSPTASTSVINLGTTMGDMARVAASVNLGISPNQPRIIFPDAIGPNTPSVTNVTPYEAQQSQAASMASATFTAPSEMTDGGVLTRKSWGEYLDSIGLVPNQDYYDAFYGSNSVGPTAFEADKTFSPIFSDSTADSAS